MDTSASAGANRRARKILVVDDEAALADVVSMALTTAGYEVLSASDGYEALHKVVTEDPDLVTLDVAMPGIDGFETLRRIRRFSDVPVIMITVVGRTVDRVKGLDLGADDYLAKPFHPKELLARIRAALRRAEDAGVPRTVFRVDEDLSIDFAEGKVKVRGKEVGLRSAEQRLLYLLLRAAGNPVRYDQLLRSVWGRELSHEDQILWLYISYLRRKIEQDPDRPRYILDQDGVAYRFGGLRN